MEEKIEFSQNPVIANIVAGGVIGDFDPAFEARVTAAVEVALEHPLVKEALALLVKELPLNLRYHNFEHTAGVLHRTIWLAQREGLNEEDTTLLAIAAAWHDTGFIKQMTKNEPIAAQWAREAMARNGFAENQIRDVETAILDTQVKVDQELRSLVQISTGRLSSWLLDADLGTFGQREFFRGSLAVLGELVNKDMTAPADLKNDAGREYIASTIRFVANHTWHSKAASDAFSAREKINLTNLTRLLGQLTGGSDAALQNAWDAMFS